MKKILFFLVIFIIFLSFCGGNKSIKGEYPEKFEGLTQLVLASETKTFVLSDTTVRKILLFKLAEAQIRVTTSLTFDFYMDFEKDYYSIEYNESGDTLTFNAPPIRVKKPVINGSQIDYPEKSIFINEDHVAVKKLQNLTNEFSAKGEDLSKKDYVKEKCIEMLQKHLLFMTKELGFDIKAVIVKL